ncbi:MAG: DinB family protein [Acidobacteriia bacterium]|nr:DinB family protein [Terriglobia bacterium]
MNTGKLLLQILDEGYTKAAWHGPNLRQSLRGVSAKQAAWRPGGGRHNIWEEALHAAYWKYALRRRIEGGKRGAFALAGSNFFTRPEKGKTTKAAWRADQALLEKEHRTLRGAVVKAITEGRAERFARQIFGIAFHDVYHAGQVRLLRRLQERGN